MIDDDGIPAFLKRDKNEVREPFVPPAVEVPVPTTVVVKQPVHDDGLSPFEKIQRSMRNAAGELIADINEAHDKFLWYSHSFNAYEFFRVKDAKPALVKLVIDRVQGWVDEMVAAKTDPELKAAYAMVDVKANIKFLTGILDDAQRWIDNQNAGKGPRKVRVVKIKPEVKVKHLKYQSEDRDLKLISVAPEKIIGAQELWTYHTKTKHLTRFVASGRSGFMVKGTTLQYFDEKQSLTKVLRKPTEVINDVLAGKNKILDKLSTKPMVPNGRINSNMILLKVK